MAQRTARKASSVAAQRGQAMMLAMVIVILGIAGVIFTMATSGTMALANRQADVTATAMAQVKEALIGWSAARTPIVGFLNRRPGELPCPDNDNTGTDAGSCAVGAIGRVPWKSLGIPEPKDSSGETLWYAIAGPFRQYNASIPATTAPITSNTQGDLSVYLLDDGGTTTTLTSQAIAVIFAPGAALVTQDLVTQDRSTTVAPCSTTGDSRANNVCAANYLESTSGRNNAQTNGPFIQAQKSGTFNDRVLAITNADLMPVVEQRVAREMIAILNAYKAATATSALFQVIPLSPGVYPWADRDDGNSTSGYNRNRFPCGTALPINWGANMALWPLLGSGTAPTLPNWLTNGCATLTGWTSVIYYSAARDRVNNSLLSPCSTCSGSMLTITNATGLVGTLCSTASSPACAQQVITAGNADLILIMPGGYTGSPARSWPTGNFNSISGYFDDLENYSNNNDTYTIPPSSQHNRDRIFIVR
jgi:hypothetical protein